MQVKIGIHITSLLWSWVLKVCSGVVLTENMVWVGIGELLQMNLESWSKREAEYLYLVNIF